MKHLLRNATEMRARKADFKQPGGYAHKQPA